MANRKISDLTALTAPASGDLLPIVDISEAAAADKNKKITIGELFASIPAGTAAAPSVAFEGDSNTGIYSPGADQVAILTNGIERARIDSSGKVGIGTNGPSYALDVSATGSTISSAFRTDQSENWVALNDSGTTIGHVRLGSTSGAMLFYAGNTERARIDNSGRVGIGTIGPSYALDVRTTGTSISSSFTSDQSEQYIALKDSGTTIGHVRLGSTSGSMLFFAGNTERARIDSSGRLLVGTANSGGALLQVNGDRIRIGTAKTPASATATGTTGEIAWDANYIYVCTATNTWKRTAIATW